VNTTRSHAFDGRRGLFAAGLLAALVVCPASALATGWDDRVERVGDLVDGIGSEPGVTAALARELTALVDASASRSLGPDDFDDVPFADLHRLTLDVDAPGTELAAVRDAVRKLDVAQYRANGFAERASTRWLGRRASGLRPDARGTRRGEIVRKTGEVCLDANGYEAIGDRDCEWIAYEEYSMHIPAVAPERAYAFAGEVPASLLSDHVLDEFEVPLLADPQLIDDPAERWRHAEGTVMRTHRTIDFFVSDGSMELYRVVERVTPTEILVREENARRGAFVQRSDGLVKITADGRGGTYYTLLASAETIFGSTFMAERRGQETVRTLAILRRYIELRHAGAPPERAEQQAPHPGTRKAEAAGDTPPRMGF